jgi:hypothetical protein
MEADLLDDLFNLPLTLEAFEELQQLQAILADVHYDPMGTDSWVYIWGNTKYTSTRLYKIAFQHLQPPITFSWIWKSKCTPRLKFFAWLLLVDRLNTKTMLTCRNYSVGANDHCLLCDDQVNEDILHLFFHCTFASSCWQMLGITWSAATDLHDKIARTRNSLNLPFFMEIFIIDTWEIWNQQNRLVFDGQAASPQLWTVKFKDQILLQSHRVAEESRPVIFQWLESTL